jgi:prepilin-type N-terminal cleavage/methylation domain-containing protein
MEKTCGNIRLRPRRKKHFDEDSGFTLIEVLVGLAIVSILAVVVGQAISEMFVINASGNARMSAVKQVENAIDIIRKDCLMAREIQLDGSDSGFPLKLAWIDWHTDRQIEITFTLDNGELKRQFSEISGTDISEVAERVIATTISSINVEVKVDPLDFRSHYVITLASTVGGFRPATEVRTFEVLPRPGA